MGEANRWGDLRRRVLSAAPLAPIVLACMWTGGAPFDVMIVLTGLGLAAEWAMLCGLRPLHWASCLLAACVAAGGAVLLAGWPLPAVAVLAAGGVLLRLCGQRSLLAAGAAYVGLPILALLWLRLGASGRADLFFLVLLVWASDIGAYMVGRWLRGPKLAPLLSPGKTWSGAAGGLGAALALALLLSPQRWAVALLLGVACQAGDLLESGIKRHVGVKDSGRLIPGHGGLLDRLDGLLAAASVFALVLLAGRGG